MAAPISRFLASSAGTKNQRRYTNATVGAASISFGLRSAPPYRWLAEAARFWAQMSEVMSTLSGSQTIVLPLPP